MPPKFTLTVDSFTLPSLPDVPPDIDPSTIRAPSIPNALSPTTPLYFTVSLPCAREKDPLYPATHLQMAYFYEEKAEVISTNLITNKNLVDSSTEEKPHFYTVEVPPESILRAKVNHEESPAAEVRVRAWRYEKLHGMWVVGRIENLGLEGFKSEPLYRRRVEQWKANQAAAAAKRGEQ